MHSIVMNMSVSLSLHRVKKQESQLLLGVADRTAP